jgi:DNA-binding beta-propeller fold protein YncE
MIFSNDAATRGPSLQLVDALVLLAVLQFMAADAFAGTLLVVNKYEDSLSMLAIDSGREIARVPTGRGPHEVEVNASGTVAVVSNYGTEDAPGATLTRVDLLTLDTSTIDLGRHTRPHGLAWLPDGRHLLVTTEGTQSAVLVDVEARSILAAIPTQGQKPHMVVVDSTGRWAFTANVDSGSVSKIDLVSRTVVATKEAGEGAEGIALASDGRLWTAANGDGTVRVFDSRTLDRLATIDVGGMAIRVELAEAHGIALVTSAVGGRITAIDMKSFEVSREVSTRWHWNISGGRFFGGGFGGLPVPVGAQLSAAGDSFYVANSFGGVVVEFSLPGLEALRDLEAGVEPDGMAITSFSPGD